MMLGEVVFGGVGAGLYGMLVFVLLAVFIAGLMVGRTPEYLGKKIEAKEMKLAMIAVLILRFGILVFTALAAGRCRRPGRHPGRRGRTGCREMLYAYQFGHRQQRLGVRRLHAPTRPIHNTTIGLAMLLGRFL